MADPVAAAVESLFGAGVRILRRSPVGGGCISRAALLSLSNGESLFLKESSGAQPGLFRAETLGLAALAGHDPGGEARRQGGEPAPFGSLPVRSLEEWLAPSRVGRGVRTPQPRFLQEGPAHQFLLLERIEQGRRRGDFWEDFGRALAELHRTITCDRFGFTSDNYIGSTPQPNGWEEDWLGFFGERRLRFQARLAVRQGVAPASLAAEVDALVERLPSLLPRPERASLLHGDLWGGNFLVGSDGRAVLIDPAVFFGHREADLAMTELFGGFESSFYAAYRERWPLEPGYEERRELYNLYHLLNHLNLFGGSYLGSVRSILARYG